jgi:hypothetical protein
MVRSDHMSTKDVLKYFDDYSPSHVEWINDSSCECVGRQPALIHVHHTGNVVFGDIFSAKRALLALSYSIPSECQGAARAPRSSQ